MDMVFNYLPDVFSYQSMRHYSYENNWLNDTTNRDNRLKYAHTKPKKPARESCRDTKDNCRICQERQRRPLATYIRSKSRQDRKEDNSILEEECEAEENPEQEEPAQKEVVAAAPKPMEKAK